MYSVLYVFSVRFMFLSISSPFSNVVVYVSNESNDDATILELHKTRFKPRPPSIIYDVKPPNSILKSYRIKLNIREKKNKHQPCQ